MSNIGVAFGGRFMDASLEIALENIKLLLKMIRDDDDKLLALEGVSEILLKNDYVSMLDRITEELSDELKSEFYKRLALIAAKNGVADIFRDSIEKIPSEEKLEILAEVVVENKLDQKELIEILKNFLKSLKSVDYNDEDICYNMAVILSFLGDFTRSRGFANSFCSLIKTKEFTFMREFFKVMDEIKCAYLRMCIGDKTDGIRLLQKILPKVKNLDEARKATLIIEACDVASRHGFYEEAIKFSSYLDSDTNKSSLMEIIFENALRNGEDDQKIKELVRRANMALGKNVEALLRISIVLRKYNNAQWKDLFSRITPGDLEKINLPALLDIIEDIAECGFKDMLEEVLKVPIYWEDLKMKPVLLFKYAYMLYSQGRISGGAKILDDYINDIIVTKERKLDPQFPIYYLKSLIEAIKNYPDKLEEVDFDKRLHEKLVSLEKEIPLPIKVTRILDEITIPKYKDLAVERIAEEILTRLRCVGIEKILTLVPEKERLEELISRVARKLAIEGDVTDALSCLELISDTKKRLDILLAMEHRCALKLCSELPGLLKMTIKTVNEVKRKIDVDPVEEAKIRLDLAIVFKFHGREKDYKNSLNEAIKRLEGIKTTSKDNILSNKILAESYGYYASALYVLGDERSNELLKKSLEHVNELPSKLRTKVLIKIITWLLFAGWYSVVFELLQLEGLESALPLVRSSLIKEYVKNERYEEALDTALSISMNIVDEVDTYICYASELVKTPKAEEVADILKKTMEKCNKITDYDTKMRFLIRIASTYAKSKNLSEAEEILNKLIEEVRGIEDEEQRCKYLALIAPALYLVEKSKV